MSISRITPGRIGGLYFELLDRQEGDLGFAEPGPHACHASRDRCLIAGAVIGSRNSVGVTRMDALPAGVRPGNFAVRPDRPISSYQGSLYVRNAARAACTLA